MLKGKLANFNNIYTFFTTNFIVFIPLLLFYKQISY